MNRLDSHRVPLSRDDTINALATDSNLLDQASSSATLPVQTPAEAAAAQELLLVRMILADRYAQVRRREEIQSLEEDERFAIQLAFEEGPELSDLPLDDTVWLGRLVTWAQTDLRNDLEEEQERVGRIDRRGRMHRGGRVERNNEELRRDQRERGRERAVTRRAAQTLRRQYMWRDEGESLQTSRQRRNNRSSHGEPRVGSDGAALRLVQGQTDRETLASEKADRARQERQIRQEDDLIRGAIEKFSGPACQKLTKAYKEHNRGAIAANWKRLFSSPSEEDKRLLKLLKENKEPLVRAVRAGDIVLKTEIPDKLLCTLTTQLLLDPVRDPTVVDEEVFFERSALGRALINGKGGQKLSPTTRLPLTAEDFISAPELIQEIEEWVLTEVDKAIHLNEIDW